MAKAFKRKRGGARQRGFTIIELIVTMALAAIAAATINSTKVIEASESAIAEGTGEYLMVLREGLSQYQLNNSTALEANDPVPGFIDPLRPLVSELKAANLINPGTPNVGPLGFVPDLSLVRTNCPGSACQITAIVRTPGSFVVPRTGNTPRYDLAISAANVMRGTYAISYAGDEANLRGATFNMPNPAPGQPGAVLAAVAFMNASFFNQFLRMKDKRDPEFQGNLSAEGNLSIKGTSNLQGNVTIGGTLTVNGATTYNSSVAGLSTIGTGTGGGCNLAELQANGNVVSQSDCAGTNRSTMSPQGYLQQTGGTNRIAINSAGGVAKVEVSSLSGIVRGRVNDTGEFSSFDAAGVQSAKIDGVNRKLAAFNASGVETASFEGVSGRGTLNIVAIKNTATVDTPCANDSDIVRDAAALGTILICTGGKWKTPGLRPATQGGDCSAAGLGVLGQDSAGVAYICRQTGALASASPPTKTWQKVNDRVTRSVLMDRFMVKDSQSITKPTCPAGASQAVVLIPAETGADYAGSPPRNRFTASVIDNGTTWIAYIRLADGTGTGYSTSFAGSNYDFQAIASTYCDFLNDY